MRPNPSLERRPSTAGWLARQTYGGLLERVHPDHRKLINQLDLKTDGSLEPMDIYIPIVRKNDGANRIMYRRVKVEYDNSGNLLVLRGTLQDVTAQKEAEQAQREDNENFRFALDASEIGTVKIDLTTLNITCSLRHDQIFGYRTHRPTWTYGDFLNHILPMDKKLVNDALKVAVETKTEWHFEYRIVRADKEIRWVWTRGQIVLDEHGKAVRMTGLVKDITEQKSAEKQIAMYAQNVIEATVDPLVTISPEGKITDMNAAFGKLVNMPREKITHSDFLAYFTKLALELLKTVGGHT